MIEKNINVETKTSFKSPSKIKKIDFRYVKNYRLAKKDKTNCYH